MRKARRILVTGGTSTTGRAIVERLIEQGDRVVITGRNRERGTVLAKATGCTFVVGDICETGAVEKIVQNTEDILGGLDGLVLNAGVLHRGPISMTSDSAWDITLETNLIAPFLFVRACIPMLKTGGGAIVAIASGTALWTEMELGVYSISKRALLWMMQMLAVEVAPYGITVNAVCPGDMEADMTAIISNAVPRDRETPLLPPLGRLIAPADVAAAVTFFLSTDSASCTGTSLTIDGGMRASLRASAVQN